MTNNLQYPFLPTADSISGLPPELANINPPAGGTMIPSPIPLPGAPQVQPKEPGVFDKLKGTFTPQSPQDVDTVMALLRFAGEVMQPVRPGQTQAGIIGNALAGAAETFMGSRKSEQDTAVKRETLAEEKRQDIATNEVEQSLIDYRKAMSDAAKDTAASKGMTESAYKNMVREQTLEAIQKNYKMSRSQAITALDLGAEVDFVNFPDIAERVLAGKAAEGGAFGVEDIDPAVERFASQGVVGTGPGEGPSPAILRKFQASSDEDILLIDNDPDLQAKAMKAVGTTEYYKRLSEALRNSKK